MNLNLIERRKIRAHEGAAEYRPQTVIDTLLALYAAGCHVEQNVTPRIVGPHLIGNGLLALLENPDQLAWLRKDPAARVENGVEELLRYDAPVQITMRVPRERISMRGVGIEPGALVFCSLGAANRDPEVHREPDRLELGRTPIRHL